MVMVLVSLGCRSDAGHERLGDEAYGGLRYQEALAHYRQAAGTGASANLLAKLGAAAVHAGDLETAAEAYRQLAATDPGRVTEAAQGLLRTAQAADRAGDVTALALVLDSLHGVAPDWAGGRLALKVIQADAADSAARLRLLPLAVAAAPDAATADSLLSAYADALRGASNCQTAVRVYRSVLRRDHNDALVPGLLHGRALCALRLGEESLEKDPWSAEGWFLEAIDAAGEDSTGRVALVRLGDARHAQGDLIGAALAYQSAMGPTSEPDSITIQAMTKLNAIATAPGPGDTAASVP